MPLAKIHVHEGHYDETRLVKLGDAIQGALEDVLGVPPEDYFRVSMFCLRTATFTPVASWARRIRTTSFCSSSLSSQGEAETCG
jgi:hypothetical protein